ncbi:hypothetical protein HOLleu_26287 [Holothuria leucospilota]|uniref:Uncharacterized protein n=1 Tax=Holothuria leucospilota TaxID=206669 RepID=A0A9Q1BU35_HOLLE|nr:hypothetical protein HOLleu_26287 [Holothuria leucospilota]
MKTFCVRMFAGCIHPVFASARRPAGIAERESQSVAGRKRERGGGGRAEKAKIHVFARMVIRRQKTSAGPLLNVSHQRAPHLRCQHLPELSEDSSRALRRDPGKRNTSH